MVKVVVVFCGVSISCSTSTLPGSGSLTPAVVSTAASRSRSPPRSLRGGRRGRSVEAQHARPLRRDGNGRSGAIRQWQTDIAGGDCRAPGDIAVLSRAALRETAPLRPGRERARAPPHREDGHRQPAARRRAAACGPPSSSPDRAVSCGPTTCNPTRMPPEQVHTDARH